MSALRRMAVRRGSPFAGDETAEAASENGTSWAIAETEPERRPGAAAERIRRGGARAGRPEREIPETDGHDVREIEKDRCRQPWGHCHSG